MPHRQQPSNFSRQLRGFTLIELILGIVTLAIALVLLTTLLYPQAFRSAEPVLQLRAANLGQALLDEVIAKSFDENSPRNGNLIRCGETGGPSCTLPAELGPDGSETRASFNDVDDFHQLQVTFPALSDATGTNLAARYPGFGFRVNVCYSNTSGQCVGSITPYKRVLITTITPLGQELAISVIKGNY